MKKVAQYQRLLDEVSFTSILFDHIQDKSKFISHMDIELKKTQGFSVDEIDRMTNDELYGAEEHKKAIDQNSFL